MQKESSYEPYLSIVLGCTIAGAVVGGLWSGTIIGAVYGGLGLPGLAISVLVLGRGLAEGLSRMSQKLAAPKKK